MSEDRRPPDGTDSRDQPLTETSAPASEAGAVVGPYRLLQKLGEGGMGEVWEAEQTEPVKRRVALKLIKHGMDTNRVIARFEAERQALAVMDHPNVAKVFDAGSTPRGRPYFAMEYVQGIQINEHCDRHKLTSRERLELFRQVCEGVQHAHQKAIIHRDLKSSNVLVSIQDGKALPKIIDFGVAKAISQQLTERTLFTEMGQLVGTPDYMSPEQAEMTGQNVDTRTDVYSLGVMLYELLVGALPFDPKELRQAGVEGIARRIREEEPPKPSTRLHTLGEQSTESARRRRVDVPTLRRQLRGDLDWITMKALEKDRTRRYGSPQELAADIRRHLQDKPVLAGPPSAAYRAQKFVRRHRFGVGSAAAFLVLLLSFAVVMAVQANRIARERDRAMQAEAESRNEAETARQVSEFLIGLFEVSDPGQTRGDTITAREILDRGAEKIEGELSEQPRVQVPLMRTIGEVYRRLGLYDRSEPLLRDALETSRRKLGQDHPDTLQAAHNLARLFLDLGRYEETERLYEETLEARRRVLGDDHPDTLSAAHNLAWLHHRQGHYDEAEPLYAEVLERRRSVLGDDHPDTLWSMHSLAWVRQSQGRLQQAEPLYAEVLERRRRVLGNDHPDTLWSMYALATTHYALGRYDDAESLHSEALALRRRVLGDDHPDTLWSMHELSTVYLAQGRLDEAESLGREVLNARRRKLGQTHPDTLWSMHNLATIFEGLRRHDEAEALYLKVIQGRRAVLGPDHPHTLSALGNLARVYANQRRYEKAEPLHLETLEAKRRALGEGHPSIVLSVIDLAVLYRKQGRYDEAEKLYLDTIDALSRTVGNDDFQTLRARYNLAILFKFQGRYEEAMMGHLEVLEAYRRLLGEDDLAALHVMNSLGEVYLKMGRYDDALPLLNRALRGRIRAFGEDHEEVGNTYFNLGCLAALQGSRKEALENLRRAAGSGVEVEFFLEDFTLDSLRGDPEFEAIVAGLREKTAGP